MITSSPFHDGEQSRFRPALAPLLVLTLLLLAAPAPAQSPAAPQHFATPQQAQDALVAAVRSDGDGALLALLGPGAEDIVASGDPVADRNGRARFLKAYATRHALRREADGHYTLLVGSHDYPFAIPIVRHDGAWQFDTAAGREEVLDRRIGRNELHTIRVLRAYVDAQRRFACADKNSCSAFARKFASDPGTRDGLYWPAAPGEPESPLGPLLARAAAEGYAGAPGPAEPFHGYFFRILTAQGPHAEGGAYDYLVGGKMLLGFALVAYPARYGVSGVMSFIVNQKGEIYQKDLGPETAKVAAAMTAYDPGPDWQRAREPDAPPSAH